MSPMFKDPVRNSVGLLLPPLGCQCTPEEKEDLAALLWQEEKREGRRRSLEPVRHAASGKGRASYAHARRRRTSVTPASFVWRRRVDGAAGQGVLVAAAQGRQGHGATAAEEASHAAKLKSPSPHRSTDAKLV